MARAHTPRTGAVRAVRAWLSNKDGEDFRTLYTLSEQIRDDELRCIAEDFGLSLSRFTRILNRLLAQDY